MLQLALLRKITDVYFKPKPFEKSGKLYEALGVKYVQKVVMATAGRRARKKLLDGKPSPFLIGKILDLESLETFERRTRFNEFMHAPVLLYFFFELVTDFSRDPYEYFFILVFALLNAPLVMLQRYNRARVEKVIEKIKSRG